MLPFLPKTFRGSTGVETVKMEAFLDFDSLFPGQNFAKESQLKLGCHHRVSVPFTRQLLCNADVTYLPLRRIM